MQGFFRVFFGYRKIYLEISGMDFGLAVFMPDYDRTGAGKLA